jgi:hypothetical protein
MATQEAHTDDLRAAIDHEVDLVNSAVDLVASGGARSTIVAGLRLSEPVVAIVRPRAAERGIDIELLWGSGETTADVRIRRIDVSP